MRGTALPHLPPIAVLLLSSGLILLSCDSATTQAVRVHLVKQLMWNEVAAALSFTSLQLWRRPGGVAHGVALSPTSPLHDSLRRLCGLETGGDVSK